MWRTRFAILLVCLVLCVVSSELLMINGDSDPRTPPMGVLECSDAARGAYRRASAEERFLLHLQENTGHKVTPAALQLAISWFEKWLKTSSK